jgi:hypothetical protein
MAQAANGTSWSLSDAASMRSTGRAIEWRQGQRAIRPVFLRRCPSLLTHKNGYHTHSSMELVQFSDALRLTGLSENQLREWCGKRGLFQPTVPPRGSGRIALYSWQDLIALRIFREIFEVFGGRASSWAAGITALRVCIAGQFFPNLWGQGAVFPDQRSAYLGPISALPLSGAALFVPFDPHLAVISSQATPEELQGQLPLVTQVGSSR